MISQNVFNIVDTAMVGSLGDAALAAVGMGTFSYLFCTALIIGFGVGVQTMTARRFGEGERSHLTLPLNLGLLTILAIGIPLSLLLVQVTPFIFPFLNGDVDVIQQGIPYVQTRLAGITFVGFNVVFRGFWNGTNRSKLYMKTLFVMHILNILFNYLLIFGHWGFPALGTTGAGIASTFATGCGAAIYFGISLFQLRGEGFLRVCSFTHLKTLFRLSLPTGIQQIFFFGGFVAMYWIIGLIGTAELAAANVLMNLSLVAILPAIGLGLAANSLVGQSLGQKNPVEAQRWGWDVTQLGVFTLFIISLPGLFFPEWLLQFFIHDPNTLELARFPLRLAAATISMEGVGLVLMNALQGAGDTKRVMYVSVLTQWFFALPLNYLVGPTLGYGLAGVWICQMFYRALLSGIYATMWKKAQWGKIQV